MSGFKDILLEDGALQFSGGDLVVGFCDEQNVEHILTPDPGSYSKDPTTGFGASRLLKGPVTPQKTRQTIKTELQADDMRVKTVEVSIDSITIEAERIK